MAKFILNLYSPKCEPDRARAFIAERFPGQNEKLEGSVWMGGEMETGKWWGKKKLTINHDPAFYVGPDWNAHKKGMQNYFLQGTSSARQEAMQMVIGKFEFNLAFILDPAPDGQKSIDSDPRAALVFDLAKELDGVVFLSGVLLDPNGLPLLLVDGEYDPDASCANLDESAVRGSDDAAIPKGAPTAQRVARRALSLFGVVARAITERDLQSLENPTESYHALLQALGGIGIEDELETAEIDVINTEPGKLGRQDAVNSMWRVEGMEVLAWALNLKELPKYDALSDVDEVQKRVAKLQVMAATGYSEAALRPSGELQKLQNRMFALHWRLRQFSLKPEKMDFARFAKDAKFGPLDITGLELIDDDLAIRGVRIDQADSDVLSEVQSIATERHLAANWLIDGGRYSSTDVST